MDKIIKLNESNETVFVGLYTIYDRLAQEPGPIFTAVNDEVANRKFQQAMKEVEYKEDYQLHCVGYFGKDMSLVPELKLVNIYSEVKDEKPTL